VIRDVTRIYSTLAPIYDLWSWSTERVSLDVALSKACIRDGDAVLEIAVGTGALFKKILRRNPSGRTVGIDLTDAMLRRARRKAQASGVAFELSPGDARCLAFGDSSFDVVINNNMFGLLPDSDFDPVLREMFRVLRPGGRLVIATMIRPKKRIAESIYRLGPVWLGGWRDVDIEPFVRKAGFEVRELQVVTQIGIPTQVLAAGKPTTR
jgi:ubiquinone/menaquinone biosynthesis C-methylase UbiE